MERIEFKLLKDFGPHKKGKKFDCFGGIVSGVTIETEDGDVGIDFTNEEYFKICVGYW